MSDAAPIAFRRATPADALRIGVLGTQVFLDTYATEGIDAAIAREVRQAFSIEAVEAALKVPASRFVLAESAGRLAGFAQFTFGIGHALVPERDAAELDRLYVQEPFTGRGLGRALLACAETEVQAEGASVLWLTAWVGNVRARGFYAARGYRERGATLVTLQGELYENRLFAKRLTAGQESTPQPT